MDSEASEAPCRQTPRLRVPLTHDHLSATGGLTSAGRLLLQTQDHAYCSPDVVRFLRLLLSKIRGKLPVIWDGARMHRSKSITAFSAGFMTKGSQAPVHRIMVGGNFPCLTQPRVLGTPASGLRWYCPRSYRNDAPQPACEQRWDLGTLSGRKRGLRLRAGSPPQHLNPFIPPPRHPRVNHCLCRSYAALFPGELLAFLDVSLLSCALVELGYACVHAVFVLPP